MSQPGAFTGRDRFDVSVFLITSVDLAAASTFGLELLSCCLTPSEIIFFCTFLFFATFVSASLNSSSDGGGSRQLGGRAVFLGLSCVFVTFWLACATYLSDEGSAQAAGGSTGSSEDSSPEQIPNPQLRNSGSLSSSLSLEDSSSAASRIFSPKIF